MVRNVIRRWLRNWLGIEPATLRRSLGIEALEIAMLDERAASSKAMNEKLAAQAELIAKLESRLASHKQEIEAFRNLMAAKHEEEDKPKKIVARRVNEVFAALRNGDEYAD